MTREPIRVLDPVIRALSREIMHAPDQQIMRIVAMVDALPVRGAADQLLIPLRHRLALLGPPRPLRFPRLIFHPLKPLIVAAARWRIGQQAIPRTVIMPIADHIRLSMGQAGTAIESRMAGRTTADTEAIAGLGRSLWPAAAEILAGSAIPRTWAVTELADTIYRPLADIVAAVLADAVAFQTLCAESAADVLFLRPETVGAILSRVTLTNPAALPMMIALLLDSVPQAVRLLPPAPAGIKATAMRDAMDAAASILLRQLNQENGTETRIVKARLADAGAAAGRIVILLAHLAEATTGPARKEQLRTLRQRLDAGCMERFTTGLRDELLTPLEQLGVSPGETEILALEATARGLRVLATEARAVGSGPAYDQLLDRAAQVLKGPSMRDKLALTDRLRLVEILAGPDAALTMLDRTP